MNQLLAEILDAHGGMNRWNEYHKVQATMVSGGGLFQLKGIPQDSAPRRMSVWQKVMNARVRAVESQMYALDRTDPHKTERPSPAFDNLLITRDLTEPSARFYTERELRSPGLYGTGYTLLGRRRAP